MVVERGMFDENLAPVELNDLKMGKIVKEKYPNLSDEDQEAARQRALAKFVLTQKAKETASTNPNSGEDNQKEITNTAFIDGVRKYVTDVKDLNIDLIEQVNPFGKPMRFYLRQ